MDARVADPGRSIGEARAAKRARRVAPGPVNIPRRIVRQGEMAKAPIRLRDLRRIYRRAKSDKLHRFWGLFAPVRKIGQNAPDSLHPRPRAARGAPGDLYPLRRSSLDEMLVGKLHERFLWGGPGIELRLTPIPR